LDPELDGDQPVVFYYIDPCYAMERHAAKAKTQSLNIWESPQTLHSKANPVCLAMANKDCAEAYEHTYQSMKAGVFQLVHRLTYANQSENV
jgi:hypothetical protein